jgi:hypothetical protein
MAPHCAGSVSSPVPVQFRVVKKTLLAMLALLAGCSGASGTAPVHAALATARQGQLTGTQLQAALVPESAFPPGYQYYDPTDGKAGDPPETGPAKYIPSSVGCDAFAFAYWQAGGETACAATAYARPLEIIISAEHGTEYLEGVDQFAGPGDANSYWHGLRQLTAPYPALGIGSPAGPVRQQISSVQLPGARAFQLDITITARFFGHLFIIRMKEWIAVAGQDVFYTQAVGSTSQSRPTPPSKPSPAN